MDGEAYKVKRVVAKKRRRSSHGHRHGQKGSATFTPGSGLMDKALFYFYFLFFYPGEMGCG